MLSKEQKIYLAQMIYNERDILFGECGPNLSKVEKQEKWIEIFIKLNSMGANIPDYKSLRDIEWSNMRRAAEKKMSTIKENESKSEEERTNLRPLSTLDEIVLDVLGKGNGSTQKNVYDLPEASQGTYLDPTQLARIKFEEDEDDDDFIDDNDDSNLGNDLDFSTATPPATRRSTRKRKKRNIQPTRPSAVPAAVIETAGNDVELYELRRKKLRLECSKLEIEIERLPLECAKLELQIQQLQRELLSNHNTM